MTDIRVGDIVKITRGEEGKPGYIVRIVTVVKGRTRTEGEIAISDATRRCEDSRVTVLRRGPKHRTALVRYNGEMVPTLVRGVDTIMLARGTILRQEDLNDADFIETCPYVPLDLIEEAEYWLEVWADRECRNPADILADIVKAVREYRNAQSCE